MILMSTIPLFIPVDNFFAQYDCRLFVYFFPISFIFSKDITITVAYHALSFNNMLRVLNFCSNPKPWNRTRDILRIYY